MSKRLLLALLLGPLAACGKGEEPASAPTSTPVDRRDPDVLCMSVARNISRLAEGSTDPGIRMLASPKAEARFFKQCPGEVAKDPTRFECLRDADDVDQLLACGGNGDSKPVGDIDTVPSCKVLRTNIEACTALMPPQSRDYERKQLQEGLALIKHLDFARADAACTKTNNDPLNMRAKCRGLRWEDVPVAAE